MSRDGRITTFVVPVENMPMLSKRKNLKRLEFPIFIAVVI
jgi:hypothetical protein